MNNRVIHKILDNLTAIHGGRTVPHYYSLEDGKLYPPEFKGPFCDDDLYIRARTQQALLQAQIFMVKPPQYNWETAQLLLQTASRIKGITSPRLSRRSNQDLCEDLEDLAVLFQKKDTDLIVTWIKNVRDIFPLDY